jgi:TolB-like protein/lipopolysaccharide biosynthesis regulator YciM
MGSLIGRTLAHYRITAAIGAGGMGEVYRATDTKLGREVALKVLPAEMASSPERLERFQREAKALAALDHSGVVSVYSVEEWGGVHFLTMQLVEGQPLDRVLPEGGLTVPQILEIASALAEALAAAHEKGIVHRDLKAANVMVTTDGRVKVLDFGLAKITAAEQAASSDSEMPTDVQTREGVVMGTVPYMSPEQVSGLKVDHRTDVFSLGVLLYEMATGRRPFQGRSSAELASAILRDAPPALEEVRSDLPDGLRRVISRCLQKNPDDRFPTARETAQALRELRSGPSSITPMAQAPSAPASPTPSTGRRRTEEGFWVAVLPFTHRGSDPAVEALAEGMSEDVVTGLARFSYLQVISRSSTLKHAGEAVDVRAFGGEVGARYVIEGSLRQAGSVLRIAVHLVDATSGAHLWAETYNRPYEADRIFEIQDEVVPRIVSTVADWYGALTRSMSQSLRGRSAAQYSAHEAALRAFGYLQHITPAEHAEVRELLEAAAARSPTHSGCQAMLAVVYYHEYAQGYNVRPDPLGRALAAAHRAVAAAPTSDVAQTVLANVLFFKQDFLAFRPTAERALALNPMSASTTASLGMMIAYAGDWENGLRVVERAKQLNPHHPGWYHLPAFYDAYRRRDYSGALASALRIGMPGYFWAHAALAAAYGQLGAREAAQGALRELLALKPDFAVVAREEYAKWLGPGELVEHVLDGLRKAGLEVLEPAGATTPGAPAPSTTTGAGPSIAVLPFANLSADKEQEYFSDGLAEEVITLLSRVTGLKVIARTSSFAFRGKDDDVRKIAAALDVTHVLEGSVRRAGTRVRVNTQLVAADDGRQVWSERYDRELSDIFAVQDEIAAAITGALRLTFSTHGAPQRYTPALPAYEAYLKGKHHQARVTPDALEEAKRSFESAIALDPRFGLAHVGVAAYWVTQMFFGSCRAHDAVPAARAAVQRALEVDPSIPDARAVLGYLSALYDLDWAAAARHFEMPATRHIGLPGMVRPMWGTALFVQERADEAVRVAERAVEEDPLEVWPRMSLHAYLQAAGRDREAYDQVRKVLEIDPDLVVARVSVAHFHAAWGERAETVAAAREAYRVGPWYADSVATLAAALRLCGEEEEARALVARLGSGEGVGDCRARAVYHILCGEIDAGADWTEKAIAERDPGMMFYLRFTFYRPLRASPRWSRIARMLNLPAAASSPGGDRN